MADNTKQDDSPDPNHTKAKSEIKLRVVPDKQRSPIGRFVREIFPELDLYDILQPYAKNIKILFQMFIGFFLAIVIIGEIYHYKDDPIPISMLATQTLRIVGVALVFSTAFELAYTLFTDGPDEAVEPLITGLAAVILVVISTITTITFDNAGGVALLVLALIGLFILRYFFIEEKGWLRLLSGRVDGKQSNSKDLDKSNISSQPSPKKANGKDATSENTYPPN